METPPTKFVLFADVLGFKTLVLDNRVPRFENLEFRNVDYGASGIRQTRNPVAKGFTGFHGAVDRAVERMAWQAAELMVFSDSIFIASQDARECMDFASNLMRDAMGNEVPLRMGVGYGTFVSYGFSFEQTPFLKFSSSQFFGSGVVYATETEKALSGGGMRIGIHQSAAEELNKDALCSDRLVGLVGVSKDVPFEWNYLGDVHPEGIDEGVRRAKLLLHVNRMMKVSPEDPHIRGQYVNTIQALPKMAVRTANDGA